MWNHIQYVGQHIHICLIYMRHHSNYLCPHTHCIYNITPTLFMTSDTPYVWHCLHYTRHHILTLHNVHCICVITSTVLMISHKLYFWDYFCYNSRHHIHCIGHDSHWLWHNTHSFDDIRTFLCMTSHPLYVQNHIHLIRDQNHILWDHTTLFGTSHALYSWHHSHGI